MVYSGMKNGSGSYQSSRGSRFFILALIIVIGMLVYYCWTMSMTNGDLLERNARLRVSNRDLRAKQAIDRAEVDNYKARVSL